VRDPTKEDVPVRVEASRDFRWVDTWYNKPFLDICDENSFLDQGSGLVIKN
jgi:hypothetical protein